jgi:hypothetical protein
MDGWFSWPKAIGEIYLLYLMYDWFDPCIHAAIYFYDASIFLLR